MRATGIVRRIDELGRVVIPKEIRRTLRIREGDPLEIYTDHDGEVVLKKYSPIGEIANIAKDYTDSLYRTLGHIACICDGARMIPITSDDHAEAYSAQLIAPILADGEIIGGLMLLSRDSGASMGEVDQKVAETTTSIIARQMEQ